MDVLQHTNKQPNPILPSLANLSMPKKVCAVWDWEAWVGKRELFPLTTNGSSDLGQLRPNPDPQWVFRPGPAQARPGSSVGLQTWAISGQIYILNGSLDLGQLISYHRSKARQPQKATINLKKEGIGSVCTIATGSTPPTSSLPPPWRSGNGHFFTSMSSADCRKSGAELWFFA